MYITPGGNYTRTKTNQIFKKKKKKIHNNNNNNNMILQFSDASQYSDKDLQHRQEVEVLQYAIFMIIYGDGKH